MKIVPKSAKGCVVASFCCALAVMAFAGWGFPDWAGAIAVLLAVAYMVAAIVRVVEWLATPEPPVVRVEFFSAEFREK